MTTNSLTSFTLPITLQKYISIYWDDQLFHYNFLLNKILEKNIIITQWIKTNQTRFIEYERSIKCLHPLPFSLPWLPANVKSKSHQFISSYNDKNNNELIIKMVEKTTIQGIPYAEPLVVTTWFIRSVPNQINLIQLDISLQFVYDKPTFLKAAIESNSKKELLNYFKLYKIEVCKLLLHQSNNKDATICQFKQLSNLFDYTSNNVFSSVNNTLSYDDLDTSDKYENNTIDNELNFNIKIILNNDDYNLLLQINYDDIDEAIRFLQYSVENVDLVYYYIRNHLLENSNTIFNFIIFITSLKSIEYSKWINYDNKAYNYIYTLINLLLCYICALAIVKYLYVILERKCSRSQSFHSMKLNIKKFISKIDFK